ncbi:PEP-CTERM sorting domain-containing protein [Pseudoduganella sp. SL102]|uniref:PEP-CTERM sorting domain-containing protein n=1 Tax=Pseudoduganella sp. SL102 TaxID=2995154 RepID=UPI00248C145D|nr:PEP-CTERM sorting domain-containing protein [Pseudoduganella sp. SL102]WBS02692.1 PEP-CTERM sorting domain-containing protein [Pseudoduganella sp. SL102]
MFRPMRSLFVSLPLLFAAAGASAAPVMTFTAVYATTGIDDTSASVYSNASFRETGERFNVVHTLRDEVVIENGLQTTSHYRDVTYDVAGHWRDAAHVDLDVTAIGEHTAQFWIIGTLLPAQVPRLIDGAPGFEAGVYLSGDHVSTEVPEYPGLLQPPPPPVFADMSSGTPAALPVWANYDPSGSFDSGATHAFTGLPGHFRFEYEYLLYANAGLQTSRIDFALFGPGYDHQVLNQGYTELLGVEVIAVPEPAIWMLLLAGAGVLTLSRHSRSQIFRNDELKNT